MTLPWIELQQVVPYCRTFAYNGLRVFVGREPLGPGGAGRWHLSIAREDRYPTWDEIKAARYDLLPDDVTVALLLPPQSEYVNIHNNCFHLHEVKE